MARTVKPVLRWLSRGLPRHRRYSGDIINMIIDYQIRTDGDEMYATYSRVNLYVEVPITDSMSSDEIVDALDSVLLQQTISRFKSSQFKDDVYVSGSIVRQDYTVETDEGKALIAQIQSEFPDYAEWDRCEFNIIGSYAPYREPYSNPSISWYDFGVEPSGVLLDKYGIEDGTLSFRQWYGLKFDMVDREVFLKAVVEDVDGIKPVLPNGDKFYALTYREDHTVSEWVDCYIYQTPRAMAKFCYTHKLDYPIHEDGFDLDTDEFIWIWGLVYNSTTLEYGPLKAYARTNI
jgi:hypothetical protein